MITPTRAKHKEPIKLDIDLSFEQAMVKIVKAKKKDVEIIIKNETKNNKKIK